MKKIAILCFSVVVFMCLLTGCNQKEKVQLEKAAEKTFEVTEEVREQAEENRSAEMALLISEQVSVKTLKISKNIAILEVTYPDVGTSLENLCNSANELEQGEEIEYIESAIYEEIKNGKVPLLTKEIEVEITYKDGEVSIVQNDEYNDAISGGLISYFNKAMEELEQCEE